MRVVGRGPAQPVTEHVSVEGLRPVRSGGGLHFFNSHSQSHSGVYSGVANLFSNMVGAAAS